MLVLLLTEAVDSRTAAMALLLAAEKEFLPPPLSFVSFRFLSFLPLLWFSSPLFLSFGSLFFLSLSLSFGFFVLLPSPLFFSFLSPLFPSSSFLCFSSLFLPLLSAFLASIYRGQGRCFLQLSWGAVGWSAIGRGCRGSVGGARWVVGHCVRSVGSRREWPAKIQKKATFSPSSPLRDRGKKMNSVVSKDFFFLFLNV